MPRTASRPARSVEAGSSLSHPDHVLNRGIDRLWLFFQPIRKPAGIGIQGEGGGLSRIYQTVTIPTGDPSRPPDSFTAFLVDSMGNRLAIPPGAAPTRRPNP